MHGVQPAAKAIPERQRAQHAARLFTRKLARVSVEIFDLQEPDQVQTEY